MVGPEAVLGIELNAYAAELARVTVWIGEIQWMLDHGYSLSKDPILKPLNNIEQRDAILEDDGTEPDWPTANVIVGNPPFLGDKRMRRELGDDYVDRLRNLYAGRVAGGADLVTYWYEKSREQIVNGSSFRAGLVATNSIRAGRNRDVLKNVADSTTIFEAWSDEPWINEGAAVRVSLICFGDKSLVYDVRLNGQEVSEINPDLTSRPGSGAAKSSTSGSYLDTDVTRAKRLAENADRAFIGSQKGGKFDVTGEQAREWLVLPNPHGRSNSDVVRPWGKMEWTYLGDQETCGSLTLAAKWKKTKQRCTRNHSRT